MFQIQIKTIDPKNKNIYNLHLAAVLFYTYALILPSFDVEFFSAHNSSTFA